MEIASEAVNQIDSEVNSIDEDCEVDNLTVKKLQESPKLSWKSWIIFLECRLSAERGRKFKRKLQNCLSPYCEIYNDFVRTSI